MFYVILSIILFILIWSGLSIRSSFKFWKKCNIPIINFASQWRCTIDLLSGRRNIAFIIEDVYRNFSNEKLVLFFRIFTPCILIIDPEIGGNVLAKSFSSFQARKPKASTASKLGQSLTNLEGEKWKKLRVTLQPNFSFFQLKSKYHTVEDRTEILDSCISSYATTNKPMEITDLISRYASDVIGNYAFGLDFNSLQNPECPVYKIHDLHPFLNSSLLNRMKIILRLINPNILPFFGIDEFPKEFVNIFSNILNEAEESRKTMPEARNNFIEQLLKCREEEMQNRNDIQDTNVLFTDDLMASNVMIFYMAGFETTATTLIYCLYELAFHPSEQEKVREEIQLLTRNNGGCINFDSLHKLTYMDMVISETLRKYPPIIYLNRKCTKSFKIPETSITIPKGTDLIIPTFPFHHDEKYFPNADKFEPERFNEANRKKIVPYTYLPFGDGPRICIGLKYAKMVIKCCLSRLLRKYRYKPCENTMTTIKIKPTSLVYKSDHRIWLRAERI